MIGKILKDKLLVKRIIFVFIGLILFRSIAAIPIPGVDLGVLQALLQGNEFLGVFNLFSGGGLENFSIAMLGVFPYITVAIVMQLLTSVIPRLHEMYHEEGEIGRKKMAQYTRIISAPVAALNAFGLLIFFQSQFVIPQFDTTTLILNVLVITAGSVLVMWIAELITEYGVGNGISIIVFAGIVVSIPTFLGQALFSYEVSLLPIYIGVTIGVIFLVWLSVMFQEAERPIPITYARADAGTAQRVSTYVPLKPNPVGVLPIIFGLTIIAFFTFLFEALSDFEGVIQSIGLEVSAILGNNYWYALVAFLLVFFFTFFYTPIVINTEKMTKNLQQSGAFIPGIRPGTETQDKLDSVLIKIILWGALFLGVITTLPILVQGGAGTATGLAALGGSAILIVVSVILDIYKKIQAHVSAYDI